MRHDENAAILGEDVLLHETDNRAARVSVQRGRRFIHDQNIRLTDDCPGNGHALLLSSAQLHRRQLGAALQTNDIQVLLRFVDCFIPVLSLENERNRHVLHRAQAGKEVIVLKYKAYFP